MNVTCADGLGECTQVCQSKRVSDSLQQNENVNRPYTSQAKLQDFWRPERRTAMKVLMNKSFMFVDMLWAMYVTQKVWTHHNDTQ